ncbi:serine hydrolase [Paraburkholderia sp. A2WS-5]|uniref:serine hydrolase n=1 Tax=unclassified Paraburkholderia TaxID=2615204 RepID=UPI003B7CC3EF
MKTNPAVTSHFLMRRRMLGTALCGALSACGGGAVVSLGPDGPVSDTQVDNALAQLDALARNLMASSGIPGMSVAVVRGAKTVFAKGYGVTSVKTQQSVDADTVFQLASVSKSVGATVVAAQVGNGVVKWDTPMSSVLPWFTLSDPAVTAEVTVGDLYAHRSGLRDHAGDSLEEIGYDQTQILQRLHYLGLDPFRTTYHYTNFGLTAGAAGVAAAAGTDWATLSQQAIYAPLGMTRTSSLYADFAVRTNAAAGHVLVNGQYVPGPLRDPDPQSPAGGVSSSANDMARWLAMLLGNGTVNGQTLIPASALQPALSQQIQSRAASATLPASYYGFGFVVSTLDSGRVTFNHSGAFTTGAATTFMVVPSMNLAIVVLTNTAPIGVPETLAYQFLDLVQYGKAQRDWATFFGTVFGQYSKPMGALAGATPPASPTPAQPLANYAGVYANDYFGPLQVAVQNNALVLTLGPAGTQFTCTHWNGDVFSYVLPLTEAPAGSRFEVSFAGQQVTLDYFNDEGLGTFTRTA